MDYKRSHQVNSFIFVAGGLLATITAVVYLGSNNIFSSNNYYHLFFKQVQGISKGSFVNISGLRVGYVKDVKFGENNDQVDVLVSIEKDYASRVTKNATAEVRTQGALGDKYIYISPGPAGDPITLDKGSITVSESADFLEALGKKSGNVGQAFDIITDVHSITSQLSQEKKIQRIVENLLVVSENLKTTSEQSKELVASLKQDNPQKVKESLAHLDSVLAKIDNGQGTLGELVNDPSVFNQVKSILGIKSNKKDYQKLIRLSTDHDEH